MSNKVLAEKLYCVLVDSYAAYLKTQSYHWNITGPQFASLHGLFEEQYLDLASAIDTLAERLRTFDVPVKADFQSFQATTSLKDGNPEASASEMLNDLIAGLEALLLTLASALEAAQKAHDVATEDLLTGRIAEHEKALWMLKSSL